ncbi:uncharacterized protein LOC120339174 [Styela clava]
MKSVTLLCLGMISFCSQSGSTSCVTTIAESARVDCHSEAGATEARCRCRGCQWCVSSTAGVPWCFHNSEPDLISQMNLRSVCPTCSDCRERIDCHPEPGANAEACQSRSCLWCPEAGNNEPWCIYGGLYLTETYRASCPTCSSCNPVNCLPDESSPTELKCKARGCLWCSSLTPQCTYGGNITAPAQYRANCQTCSTCTMKYDCHPEPDATQTVCESRGCMWCQSSVSGEPWCVYGGTTVTTASCTTCANCNTKIDCHPQPYATKWSCENRGCIWCPTTQSGIPYCVYPTI